TSPIRRRWLKIVSSKAKSPGKRGNTFRPLVETMEDRVVPSANAAPDLLIARTSIGIDSGSYPEASSFTPAQMRQAYGFDHITFGSIKGDGTGQTIAIVDAYDDPKLVSSTDPTFLTSDLHVFDQTFGLPDPPSFQKINQTGGTTPPSADAGWGLEISLDVE